MNFKAAALSTLLHVLELVVCLAAAYFILKLLNVDSQTATAVTGIALNALVKFNRASDASPMPDYVNPPEQSGSL